MIMITRPVRGWSFALLLTACSGVGNAGNLLYTFGLNTSISEMDSLSSMDPASVASVTNVQPQLGDGNTAFNGGLVAVSHLLYGIGNDGGLLATLYSFDTNGQNLSTVSSQFNNTGGAANYTFLNGLTAVGSTFYAVGTSTTDGSEALFQIGNGTATLNRSLPTPANSGAYAGIAWDPMLNMFYGIVVNAGNVDNPAADYLVHFGLGPSGGYGVTANLTKLDGAEVNAHLGGLADAGGGILYDIFTDPISQNGQLEQITVSGPGTATVYDTGVPLAQNAGIAIVSSVPEPASAFMIGAGLILLAGIVRRRKQ
jgi:hypothetical protein